MILACAVAAGADYVVTRDDDLLSLGTYKDVAMVTPEAFLTLVRRAESGDDHDTCEGGGVVDTQEI